MQNRHGKCIWSFLRNQRWRNFHTLVIADNCEQRSLSLAYGICDTLRQPRTTIWGMHLGDQQNHQGEPPMPHVYELTKHSRSLVL
jgi:hypothetical protein